MAASPSKFQKLARTHALMMGGDSAMVIALADSFFFDVDPNGARTKVLLFLVVSFAPFLLVAPFVGPVIDRVRGGRRMIVQGVALARVITQLLMVYFADGWMLFPLVFVALVLQKTYFVSRSALVPSVVRDDAELVEANSKLGLIAGVAGAVAVLPAGLLQVTLGSEATFAYGAVVFAAAFAASLQLAPELAPQALSPGATPTRPGRSFHSPAIELGAAGMMILRAGVGFMLFHTAFWFRSADNGDVLLGTSVALGSVGIFIGNTVGPRLRRVLHEERMLALALALSGIAGVVAALIGGPTAGIAVALVVNLSAALGRLAFDSMLQRDGPAANRGQAFALFETRFQLAWVAAAVVPVLFDLPGRAGLFLVGAVAASAVVNYLAGTRGAGGVEPDPASLPGWSPVGRRPGPAS